MGGKNIFHNHSVLLGWLIGKGEINQLGFEKQEKLYVS